MTLAERLRKVALFLENEAKDYDQDGCPEPASDCRANATELRALADYVEGRVVVKPWVAENPANFSTKVFYAHAEETLSSDGPSSDKAVADLQRRLDALDRRTLP